MNSYPARIDVSDSLPVWQAPSVSMQAAALALTTTSMTSITTGVRVAARV